MAGTRAVTCGTLPEPVRPAGVGFAAVACLGARLRPGAELVQELTGLEDALKGADLVVTGEGSLDEQTLNGKAPAGVAAAARAPGRARGRGGRTLSARRAPLCRRPGSRRRLTLAERARDLDDAMARPGALLEEIGAEIGRRLARGAS